MADTPLPRSEFPVTDRWTYLNHAGVAPLPHSAAAAVAAYGAGVEADGGEAYRAHEAREAEVRAAAARLMGVPVEDVAFVKNTTEGLAFVSSGLDWQPGDRVVVPACEFPSNLYPWLALADRGVDVVQVEPEEAGERLPMESFEAALAGGARVLAVSWVQYGRGWQADVPALSRLAHAHGALFVLDAIQALGCIPAHFADWGVDVASADGHKWLLGPEGCGVMYASPAAREQLRVLEPGWNSVVHRQQWENRALVLDPTARRFEAGTQNYAGIFGLGASIDLLLDAGLDEVWAHVNGLCEHLAAGLCNAGAELLTDRADGGGSGIVTFAVAGMSPTECTAALVQRGFSVRARGGGVRVSPHGYNTPEEIDAFVSAVAALVRSP
ncbi:MAG: aminotransferase class V-fold PLP-dependent enzyme [Actinobacteria bacterium]|nr:aminotransferase class V-fold PLP-dependent enzyme [Actinomycetota bacterium]